MSLWRRLKNLWYLSELVKEMPPETTTETTGNKPATIVDLSEESPLDKIDLT